MQIDHPSPAGEGGAGRACLAADARSTLSPAAYRAQRQCAHYPADLALAAAVAAVALGITAR